MTKRESQGVFAYPRLNTNVLCYLTNILCERGNSSTPKQRRHTSICYFIHWRISKVLWPNSIIHTAIRPWHLRHYIYPGEILALFTHLFIGLVTEQNVWSENMDAVKSYLQFRHSLQACLHFCTYLFNIFRNFGTVEHRHFFMVRATLQKRYYRPGCIQ
jgi:hypothetical protein